MITVKNEVRVYEENGKDCPLGESRKSIGVESHHIRDDLVVLIGMDGMKTTVVARDLQNAITNATNTH